MTLLEECIEALGNCEILSSQKSKEVLEKFESMFPITAWARIDWDKIQSKKGLVSIDEIIPYLINSIGEINTKVYIIWDDATLLVIGSELKDVLRTIDDVTACSFDTWIFSPIS